jgi:thiol-disulfide isomerase/thioredoxin
MKRPSPMLTLALFALATARAPAAGVWTPVAAPKIGGTVSRTLADKPLVVRVHADWCGECQTTLPDFRAFTKAYGSRINVVDVDVTDGRTASLAEARAKRLGLGAYYESVKTAPLTVAFINPDSGKTYAALRGNVDYADLVAAERLVERSLKKRS